MFFTSFEELFTFLLKMQVTDRIFKKRVKKVYNNYFYQLIQSITTDKTVKQTVS